MTNRPPLVVCYISGSGSEVEDFSDPHWNVMAQELVRQGFAPGRYARAVVDWRPMFAKPNRRAQQQAQPGGPWKAAADLFIDVAGDALPYLYSLAKRKQVWSYVRGVLRRATLKIPPSRRGGERLMLIGHSFGCQIIFDYLKRWQNKPGKHALTQFINGRTLAAVAMMGSPLWLTLSCQSMPIALDFPGSLDPLGTAWVSYKDKQDMIGVEACGDFLRHEDVIVSNPGLIGLTPGSHNGYYKNRDVAIGCARLVAANLGGTC